MAFLEVREQSGVGRRPTEYCLGASVRGRAVECNEMAEKAEVRVRRVRRDRTDRKVEVSPDYLRDLAERDSFVFHAVQT